jgi:hypothetical protein
MFGGICWVKFLFFLDAYDEFRNWKWEDREREGLRSFLAEISPIKRTRILITTRAHWRKDLENALAEAQVAEMQGDLKDVTRYLDSELQPRRHLNDRTKNLIRTKILEANRDNPWWDQLYDDFSDPNMDGNTPLQIAEAQGRQRIVKWLVELGICPIVGEKGNVDVDIAIIQ